MYISDLTHFLNEEGNIPTAMPVEAREFAGFLAMIVDITTEKPDTTFKTTTLRCNKKGCKGLILSALTPNFDEVHWHCPDCNRHGIIRNWQGTKWDNIK
jgi:hypothetical protein